jgi:arylsulfatase A-like enzyme
MVGGAGKKTNFELGVRVPFLLKVPWLAASMGQRSSTLVELVDLFFTLPALVGLPAPPPLGKTGGVSLLPVILNPQANHSNLKPFAYSQ